MVGSRPENILYRTRDKDSDIVIADFGMYVRSPTHILPSPSPPLSSFSCSRTGAVDRAKHLHSSEEQLMSLAGSFGYVAPEVLNKKGHGKAVDLWSTGYVDPLSPFLLFLTSADFSCGDGDGDGQDHHVRPPLRLLALPE